MKGILYFIGGVVVGSAATFLIMNKICEDRIDEEIAEVKKTYAEKPVGFSATKIDKSEVTFVRDTMVNPKELFDLNNQRKADILKSNQIIDKQNYNLFSKPPHAKDIHNGIDEDEDLEVEFVNNYPREGVAEKPYIIKPDQFVNEEPYFDKISLEYFDDGILANALSEEIIEDIEAAVGKSALTKFGEYEDDVVYVRNENRSTDYEIIRQYRPFAVFDEDDG